MAPKTIKKALLDTLEDLTVRDFNKFCYQLLDRREEPRVTRHRVEGKDRQDVVDVLVSTFTEQGAVFVAVEILRQIACNQEAVSLGEATGGCVGAAGFCICSGCVQLGCNGDIYVMSLYLSKQRNKPCINLA